MGNTTNQLSIFRIKNWFKINDDVHEIQKTNSQIKFKITILKSKLRGNIGT